MLILHAQNAQNSDPPLLFSIAYNSISIAQITWL
jgi:hypothetical protein